ncbi:unnamed protein product [Vicia faba]|uniref:Cadmium-induced protein AS8 n=1 Tax=Vicia faba TaxID=3906 RepID=A0AAV1AHA9_VICFA|nr:unnamed protein product [Vicia faba]
MIIKGLFRRYKKWNPVHPTYGAFYGMGFGVGCGVGWGPGFGPEVVGYVGSGCGVGFNVGVTLAGIGIGLPANVIFAAPYNAFLATKSSALKLACSATQTAQDVWIRNSPLVSDFQREAACLCLLHLHVKMYKHFMTIFSLVKEKIDSKKAKTTIGFVVTF